MRRRQQQERGTRAKAPRLLAPAIAALLACLVYLNALDNPFVYDDRDTVVANPSLVDPSNVGFVLAHSPFRPILNLSYALDRWSWGLRPIGYHLTNVGLHALAVVLLHGFLVRALEDAHKTTEAAGLDAAAERSVAWAAFTGASIFAVHPLMTEAVGYVSGRSEVLCAVWFLAAMLLGRRAMITGNAAAATGAAASGILALATKETAVALPVVLVAYDWLLRPGTHEARRRRWLVFAPIFALVVAAALYRVFAFDRAPSAFGLGSPFLNFLTQAIVVWRYLGLLVWPVGQSIMHEVHRVSSVLDPLAWCGVGGLLLAAFAAFRVRVSAPLVPFGIVWFFAVLAPSSSVIALREGMAEHRVYLAVAGLLIALSTVQFRPLEGARRPGPSVRVGYKVAGVLVLLVLSALTLRRNEVWASPASLWTEAVSRASGMWEPRYALGDALREAGNCAAAVAEYRQVVAMRPAHRDAHTNLGICLGQTGQLEEAEGAFRRALEIDPGFARGFTNLGALALVAGDPARARDFYLEAIRKDSQNVLARMQLARLYEQTFEDYHAAARMCGEVRALAPATPGVVDCVERNRRRASGR